MDSGETRKMIQSKRLHFHSTKRLQLDVKTLASSRQALDRAAAFLDR